MSIVFQPLVDIAGGSIFGFEACTRGPADGPLHDPLTLFAVAERLGLLMDLERLCIRLACERFAELRLPSRLFLNAGPATFTSPGFPEFVGALVASLKLDVASMVFEITEQQPLDDYAAVRLASAKLRALGAKVAIDDLGAGFAGLRFWTEIKPDFVKIDRHFISGINESRTKYDFVRSVLEVSRRLGCEVIAEGIEQREELVALSGMGIRLGQGFLLGMPKSVPMTVAPLPALMAAPRLHGAVAASGYTAADLVQPSPAIDPDCACETVLDQFLSDESLIAIPIVRAGTPAGIVTRRRLLDIFAARYTRELHGRKPIMTLRDQHYICVPRETKLEEVSRLLTENQDGELTQVFLITSDDSFLGIGDTRTLLRLLTEQQLRYARHSSPLTLLPGNASILEKIDEMLGRKADFRVAYLDLNYFKPYNDLYGFNQGDKVLLLLAELLRRYAHPQLDFIGHIGGDDFILVMTSPDWAERCQNILDHFAEQVKLHYPSDAVEAGGIYSQDRSGTLHFFPLLSVAIGVIHPDPERCSRHHEIAALASEAKSLAKKQQDSKVFLCRRRGPA